MKKSIAILLALCLMLSLAACGTEAGQLQQTQDGSQQPTDPQPGEESVSEDIRYAYYLEKIKSIGEVTEFTYDENWNLLSEITYLNDEEDCSHIYTYDENGNLLSETARSDSSTGSYDKTYDARGNLLSEIIYRQDGTVEKHCSYTYDELDRMLTQSYYSLKDGSLKYTIVYTYDSHSGLISEVCEYPDGTIGSRFLYTCDEQGNRLTRTLYDSDGTISAYCEYTYDENGHLLEYTDYGYNDDAEQYLDYRSELTYDQNGNMLSKNIYNADGSFDFGYTYTYDENGNMLSEVSTDDEGIDYSNTWTYDENGNLLTEYLDHGMTVTHNVYTYDAEGRMLTEIGYEKDGSISKSLEYVYADHGGVSEVIYYLPNGDENYRETYSYIAVEIAE